MKRFALVCVAGLAVTACGGGSSDTNPNQFGPGEDATSTPTRTSDVAGATTGPSTSPTTAPTPTGTYTVVSGDTLWAIAEQFSTTVDALVAANNLADPSAIQIGQVLTIPQSP